MAHDDEQDAEVAEELDEGEVRKPEAEAEDEGSDADAEVAEEEHDDEDEGEIVGAVKTRATRSRRKRVEEDESEADAGGEDEDEDDESSKSDVEEEDWEAVDDDAGEDMEAGNAGNRCVYVDSSASSPTSHRLTCVRFCGQSEEDDPSDEYEEYLACAVCGDNCKSTHEIVRTDMQRQAMCKKHKTMSRFPGSKR